MSGDGKRVQFQAPRSLVDRADALATVQGTDRREVFVSALQEYLVDVANDEFEQEIAGAYYDDEITFEQLASLVGKQQAANFRLLKRQLDEGFIEEVAEL